MAVNNLLITGAAGFIGSNFIELLCSIKEKICNRIIVLDALTYCGKIENLVFTNHFGNYIFIYGNICDRVLLDRMFNEYKIDGVINFAAETHVDRSISTPEIFAKTNVCGTVALLDSAVKYKVKRFLQVSTDEVYGSLSKDDPAATEESLLKPRSPYSASKAAADHFVLAYANTYGLPVVITRSSNNYGRRQFPEKFIPTVILNALKNNAVPLYGNGENIRDWIYVKDNCRAILNVFKSGKNGEIYNVAGGNELSNISLARKILIALGKSSNLFNFTADRPGHDYRYSLNCDKLKQEIGWAPEVSIEKGLAETIDYYKTNLYHIKMD